MEEILEILEKNSRATCEEIAVMLGLWAPRISSRRRPSPGCILVDGHMGACNNHLQSRAPSSATNRVRGSGPSSGTRQSGIVGR